MTSAVPYPGNDQPSGGWYGFLQPPWQVLSWITTKMTELGTQSNSGENNSDTTPERENTNHEASKETTAEDEAAIAQARAANAQAFKESKEGVWFLKQIWYNNHTRKIVMQNYNGWALLTYNTSVISTNSNAYTAHVHSLLYVGSTSTLRPLSNKLLLTCVRTSRQHPSSTRRHRDWTPDPNVHLIRHTSTTCGRVLAADKSRRGSLGCAYHNAAYPE